MIFVAMTTREQTGDQIGVDVVLRDEGTSGIGLVQVLDRGGLLLHEDHLGCRPSGTLSVPPLPAAVFPLRVLAQDCEGAATETDAFDLLPPWGDPEVGVPVDCTPLGCMPTDTCNRARFDAMNARRTIVDECDRLSAKIDEREEAQRLSLSFLLMSAVLGAAAAQVAGIPFLGTVLAAILIAAAAIALIQSVHHAKRFGELKREIPGLKNRLREQLAAYRELVAEAFRRCCSGCDLGDLSEPPCPI